MTDNQAARRREFLASELDSYRSRWRASEHVGEQRLTMLLTIVASMLAASAIVLAREDPATDINDATGVGWVLVAIISVGMMLRLINARISVVRSIACANALRIHLATTVEVADESPFAEILAIDSSPLAAFELTSLPAAAALLAGSSISTGVWFLEGATDAPHPWLSLVPGVVAAVAGLLEFHRKATQFIDSAEQLMILARPEPTQ